VTCHDSVVNRSWRTVATARTGALALGALGAAFGLLTLAEAWSAPAGSFGGTSWAGALAELAAGWALITAGVAESWRKPASREGLLLAGAGIGWFFTDWNNPGLGSPAAFTFWAGRFRPGRAAGGARRTRLSGGAPGFSL